MKPKPMRCECGEYPVVGPVWALIHPPVITGYMAGCKKCHKHTEKCETEAAALAEWDAKRKAGLL